MVDKIKTDYFKTHFGELIIGSFKDKLCLCDWRYRKNRKSIDDRISKLLNANFVQDSSSIIDQAKNQLSQYFNNKRTDFNLPIELLGSEFQISVWKELLNIPFGKTISYKALSKLLNHPEAIRAIANANGANAISIIVPCHRIIGSNGELVGYAGGIDAKKKLLLLEGALINNQLKLFS